MIRRTPIDPTNWLYLPDPETPMFAKAIIAPDEAAAALWQEITPDQKAALDPQQPQQPTEP